MSTPFKIALVDSTNSLPPGWLADCAEMISTVTSGVWLPGQTIGSFGWSPPYGWGVSIQCRACALTDVAPDECPIVNKRSDPSIQGELGDHSDPGRPQGQVFSDLEDSIDDLSVTFMHEAAEAAMDWDVCRVMQGQDGVFRALEVGDAVEAQWFPFTCKSQRVLHCSNLTLPKWHSGTGPGALDLMGLCATPGQILSGGYMSVFADGAWSQVQNGQMRPYRARLAARGMTRHARRVARAGGVL